MEENNINPEQPNKTNSNKGIFIVIAVMAIIIIALVGYIVVINSETSNESEGEENQVSTSKVSKDDEETDDEEEDAKNNTSKNSLKNNSKTEDKNNTSKNTTNSTFGKKDKNETNTTSNTSKKNTTTSSISSDWKDGEFIFDGVAYKLNGDYQDFVDNGWSVDLSKAGYDDGYILNKNDKTYSTVDFENSDYEKADVNVGFINLGDSAKDITECQIWAISVNNKYTKTPVDFELAGGIKYGSTLEEVEAVYGKPEDEDDIYRSDDLGYTTYTYDNDLSPQLRLTIYDEDGLTGFDYKTY